MRQGIFKVASPLDLPQLYFFPAPGKSQRPVQLPYLIRWPKVCDPSSNFWPTVWAQMRWRLFERSRRCPVYYCNRHAYSRTSRDTDWILPPRPTEIISWHLLSQGVHALQEDFTASVYKGYIHVLLRRPACYQ